MTTLALEDYVRDITTPAPGTYTRHNHPLRNVKPDREAIERMFAVSRVVADNIARIFPDLTLDASKDRT